MTVPALPNRWPGEDGTPYGANGPRLKPGERAAFHHAGRHYLILGTHEVGSHTGRMRYLVVCGACQRMLHEATTGPSKHIRNHSHECLAEPNYKNGD